MSDVIIGIDIGLSGGIAFFDFHSKEILSVYSMPVYKEVTSSGREKGHLDIGRLKSILEIPKVHNESATVVMENVHAFPGQGVVAMATLMEQKGILLGLAEGLEYNVELVEPRVWQKRYELVPPKDLKGTSASKTKTLRKKWLKENSLITARALFPEWAEKKLVSSSSHGLSDAMLIGKWYIETK